MRFLLLCALALTAFISTPALAGDPETCSYRQDPRLSEACRRNPHVRAFLFTQPGASVEYYVDVPVAVRGYEPGERERIFAEVDRVTAQQDCYFRDELLSLACTQDPQVRTTLAYRGRGTDTNWFVLPPEIGGQAPHNWSDANRSRHPRADQQRLTWRLDAPNRNQRISELERTIGRQINQRVTISRAYLIAVDGVNFVLCGYAFTDGGGYEAASSGAFVFDTRGGSAMRAAIPLMREKCNVVDQVLR